MKLYKQMKFYQTEASQTGRTEKDEETIEVTDKDIEDADPDKLNEYLGEDYTPDPDEEDEKATETDEEKDQKKEEESEPGSTEEKDDEPGEVETPEIKDYDPNKMYKIDDEFIASRPENERKALEEMKGQSAQGKMIKSYVHSQLEFAKRKQESEQHETETDFFKAPEKKETDTRKPFEYNPANFEKTKDSMINDKMNELFPERPKDPEELSEFEDNLQAELGWKKAREYERTYDQIEQQVTADLGRIHDMKSNPNKYAQASLQQGVAAVNKFFTESVGKSPKELGYDFNDKGLMNKVLGRLDPYSKKFTYDPEVVIEPIKGVRMIDPVAFLNKFQAVTYKEQILRSKTEGRQEGFEAATTTKPNTTVAGSGLTGRSDKKQDQDLLANLDNINDPAKLDEILNNAEIKME